MSDVEDLAAAHGAEVVSSPLAPRGRRAGRDAAAAAADKFARLRERRRAPGSASSARRLAEYDDIYDEVTEDHYNAIVKGRLKEEDFVVDDDGRGYAENGLEEWDDVREDEYSTGSEAEVEKRRRSDRKDSKRKRKKDAADNPSVKPGNQIHSYFRRQTQLPGQKKPQATTQQEDQLMSEIFEGLDEEEEPFSKRPKNLGAGGSHMETGPFFRPLSPPPRPRRYSAAPDDLVEPKKPSDVAMDSTAAAPERVEVANDLVNNHGAEDSEPFDANANDDVFAPMQDARAVPPAEVAGKAGLNEPVGLKLEVRDVRPGTVKSNASGVYLLRPAVMEVPAVKKEPQPEAMNWSSNTFLPEEVKTVSPLSEDTVVPAGGKLADSVFEEDGSLRMYWIDVTDRQGTVYLFGKVLNRATKSYVSCCAVVQNIERNVFVLPRKHKVDASGTDTGVPVAMVDVYREFDHLRKKFKIKEWLSKEVKRSYAFEVPDVPRESEYLKVAYKYDLPALPSDLTGETFSHIFGTNTTALEQFLLKRRLKGPGWLEIKGARLNRLNISWAKLEVVVDDPKLVRRVADVEGTTMTKTTPPMNIFSVSLRTAMNSVNKNEIMIASVILYEDVVIDHHLDFRKMPCRKYTVVRQPSDRPLPAGFEDLCKQRRFPVEVVRSERQLLNYLVALFSRADPDVIVGHNFVGFDLSVLLARMKDQKVDGWSRLGRLRRHQWPQLASIGDTNYATKAVVSGRLICDTYLQAKDLVPSKNYKLGELASSQLRMPRDDIDYEKIILYFGTATDLHGLANHCCYDAFLAMGLTCHLQALVLTKELTCLAGNLWSQTLLTGRAERNEILLLHEFHELKYICPDKVFGTAKANANRRPQDDNDVGGDAAKKADVAKRKPAYAGGLVLEPKKGLYDKFVLLLDFNSLYPSIIQEFNICFTTVKRTADAGGENEIPDAPDSTVATGVLPKLLKSLVERRRNVKSLMKRHDTTAAQKMHYDIVQKALKLTANSMYGCLGFLHSRFYAKQLAMLITSKGREILQNTVDLAEKQRLEVVYGDTDSIMINTNSIQLDEVKRIGEEFKREVNKRYRLLEIETDAIFQRMLLLKKKKYAALIIAENGGRLEAKIETKGLDMVRRDWCELSKDVSNYVLNQVMSSENRDAAVEEIHQHLSNVAEDVRKGAVPLEKFIINKSLSKAPEHYPDKNSQPHVTVALQMKARGLNVQVGEIIPYVICEEEAKADREQNDSSASRARHPDDLRKAESKLKIDYEWYLNNQIHPPVARLLDPIDGTDAVRIADCLGLDPSKFRGFAVAATRPTEELYTLDSQMSDAERFKNVERFTPSCRHCGQKGEVEGVTARAGASDPPASQVLTCGLDCPNLACGRARPLASLEWQLVCAIRRHVRRYIDGWLVCDDSACGARTRMMSVYGRRCLQVGCHGTMVYEYSGGALYTQLRYYESLFDVDRAKSKAEGTAEADVVRGIADTRRGDFAPLHAAVRNYANLNARGYVNLQRLFSFCTI